MNKVLFEVNYIGNFHGLFNIVLAFGLFFFLFFGMRRTAKEHKKAWERKLAKILMKADIVIIVIYTMHLIKGYADIVVQYTTLQVFKKKNIVQDFPLYNKFTTTITKESDPIR